MIIRDFACARFMKSNYEVIFMEEKRITHTVRVSEEKGLCKLIREVCDEGKKMRMEGTEEIDIAKLFNNKLQMFFPYVSWKKCQDVSFFSTALEQVDTFLLEMETREKIKNLLTEVMEARKQLLDSLADNEPFPGEVIAVVYRNKYTRLLYELLGYARELDDFGKKGNDFLQGILNVDIEVTESERWASLYSPAAIDALLCIYNNIGQYIDKVTTWGVSGAEAKILESNYQAVIISKALREFRWIIVKDNELFQAAIPAAVPVYEDEDPEDCKKRIWSLDIPVRDLEDYNSYEGIGELRLFDKIIYELEKRKGSGKVEFHVLIVGDILKKPIEVLCQAVEGWIRSQKCNDQDYWSKIDIFMTILTRNKWESKCNIPKDMIQITPHVNYKWEKYEGQLLQGGILEELIKENDWMFLLDACNLYNDIYIEEQDVDLIEQRLFLTGNCSIAQQQQVLYAVVGAGAPGIFKKEINRTFLKYLSKQLKKFGDEAKNVYVYVSDLDAISELDFFDENFIRIERYNNKEFLILRMPGMDEAELKEIDSRRIIVMNLWQVIKHCTVRNIDCFLDYFGLDDISTAMVIFRDTLIGVEYEQWRCQLIFYYSMPDCLGEFDLQLYEKHLKSWIKTGIMPYFKNQPGNVFYNYFVKAFSTFLYSDAKCVDDMLFLHLFVDKHELLKNIVFGGKDTEIRNYQSASCKYSQKQFYATAMEDYDTSSEMFVNKYRKLDLMERADVNLRRTIFQKIVDSCQRNQYEDSYLMINCQKMI